MGFPVSEAYGLPVNAKSLVGSVMANLCGSHYPLHMAKVEVSSQRILVDKAFSASKCVRLARMAHHSHKLLKKILGTVPREQRDDLSKILGEELLNLEGENTSDFERQNTIGKPMNSAPAQEENDTTHEKEPGTSTGSFRRTQPPEHRFYIWGMPKPLLGTYGVVPGTLNLLLSKGRGRNSVDRITRSSAEGDHLGSKHNVGVAMDRGERDEISGIEETDSGIDIR